MAKKRFLLAILLVTIFVLISANALAGCCRGIIGCSRAPGIPKATYRATCLGMTPLPSYHFIKAFTTNPAAESAYANSLCSGARPPCTYSSCEQPNTGDCTCGSTSASSANPFCCGRDNSVFPNFGACTASPSCRVGNFYSIHGRVLTPEGFPIAGAEVRAGGKQVLSDDDGNFTIDLLPDLSSGTVVAIKNSTINSTGYTIGGANVFGLEIILNIVEGPPAGMEICTNGADDDGDQFGWNSSLEGLGDAADRCDPDCGATFGITLSRAVTKTYYDPRGEYYVDGA
ncbi:carboxypeptidase-like regulatory domain-containing protein, partial [Candidatus Woesearchaeota archaeon]|nr:carboxypeptidase-like regulatory domain-containing protein [Candidatus Woesearchaeota archaeon]